MKKKHSVANATDGILRTSVNTVLWWIYLQGSAFGASRSTRGAYDMFQNADDALSDFNYDSFKAVLKQLRRKGYIAKPKTTRSVSEIVITKEGHERLKELVVSYKATRTWDGYIYLISYDIAESHRRKRDMLRNYLRRIGCGLLQKSLWITPYSPRDLVYLFVKEHVVEGTILVSKLGKDGWIGDEDLSVLLDRVYDLPELNEAYEILISDCESGIYTNLQLSFRYYRILKQDPQLPFQLLPPDWLGDKAYEIVQAKGIIL